MRENAAGPAPADAVQGNIVDRFAPSSWQPYLRMARIDRPIGWWLLLLPCWWSAALAAASTGSSPRFDHILLFLIGAIAMRGAGCVWNDIVDRDLDRQVERTRNRPLPSGRISVRNAVLFASALCLIGLIVLFSLNRFSIGLGFLSLLPVAVYPFMKRITDYPQAVLGLAFSWGALMGWAAFHGQLGLVPLLLYAGSIFWVIGYDTVYALQDIEDDGIVGIRSTARRFGVKAPAFIAVCYGLTLILLVLTFWLAGLGLPSWIGFMLFGGHLVWQIGTVTVDDPVQALRLFKSNRNAGLMLFAGLMIDCFI